jgi:hypothetical protein
MKIVLISVLFVTFLSPDQPNMNKMVRREADVQCDCKRSAIREYERVERKVGGYLEGRTKKKKGQYGQIKLQFDYDFKSCNADNRSAELRAYVQSLTPAQKTAFDKAVSERLASRCNKYNGKLKQYKINGY